MKLFFRLLLLELPELNYLQVLRKSISSTMFYQESCRRSFLWSKTSGQTSPGRSATMTITKPKSHFLNEKKKDAALSERLALWADSLKDNLNQKIIDTAKGMAK